MTRFQTKRPDGRAEWRVIFDLVADANPDDQFSYAVLGAALETNDRHVVQQAVRRANRELWERRKRSLGNVPRFGYRMLRPVEHEDQATGYQKRSQRQMKSAVAVISATDLGALTDAERTRILIVTGGLIRMVEAIRFHQRKIAHHDQLISDLESRITRLEQD